MFCSKCGSQLAAGSAFCQVCGTPAPAGVPVAAIPAPVGAPLTPGASADVSPHWLPPPTRSYAGFWLRFLAMIIDALILSVVSSALFFPIMAMTGLGAAIRGIRPGQEPDPAFFAAVFSAIPLIIVVSIALKWLYFAYSESSEWQATPGKKVLNLIVTDMNGNRISFARASGRYFGKYVSGFTLFIGYIMAGFTQRKQALHDILADCLVLRS